MLHGHLAQEGQTEHLLCSSRTLTHGGGHDQVAKNEVLSTGAIDHQQAEKLEAVGIRGKTPQDFCSGESVQKGSTQPQSLGDLLPVSHRQIWGFQRNTGDFG